MEVLEETECVCGAMMWKTPRAERQLSTSEETGDINCSLSPQFCPSHPR